MHYCVGDVHGCYDEMISLLRKIEMQDDNAQFIFTGDFVDRGPKVWETMEWVATHLTPVGRFTGLVGNHDRLLFEWYFKWLNRYIGAISAMPYHKVVKIKGRDGVPVIYDIVHGWYAYDYPENSYGQRMFNTWARECEGNHANDHIIIHGHTPTITDIYTRDPDTPPGMIAYRKNAINLDGGCCYFTPGSEYPCMLCAICLETLEEFYSSSLKERLGEEKGEMFRRKYYTKENPYRKEILERLART